MGNKKQKYLRKIEQQLVNKKENVAFYQNGSEWHSQRTESERTKHRKLDK